MRFYKYNGAGNDFIIINNIAQGLDPARFPAIAKTLCTRRMSIGADGLMVVERSATADFRMVFYNSDGSLGEMCGNGARCICRFGYEMGLSGETQTVETMSGPVRGERIDARNYRVQLTDPSVVRPVFPVELDGRRYDCGYVELGSPGLPHAVIPMPGLRDIEPGALFALGRALRHHPAFPKGANINFYDIIGENQVFERTYERGVEDFTYACGTGTASVAIVLAARGLTAWQGFSAEVAGGHLGVDISREGETISAVYLTGPTNTVAVGEVLDEDLPTEAGRQL